VFVESTISCFILFCIEPLIIFYTDFFFSSRWSRIWSNTVMKKGLKCYIGYTFCLWMWFVPYLFFFLWIICREVYESMLTRYRERGRSRSGKAENISLQHLQIARDEYDEEATLFVFRLKSLKQGQSWSLLTQAARHHAAQVLLTPNISFSNLRELFIFNVYFHGQCSPLSPQNSCVSSRKQLNLLRQWSHM